MMNDKTLIVVLGMHRGGTSAITRGLKTLGASLGDKLLDPHEHNPKGFWEDKDILDLDIEMLQVIGQDWDHIAAVEPCHVEILHKKGYFLRAAELLRTKTAGMSLFAFKDPRIAKLMPFWKEVFTHCQVKTNYLIIIRHPLSVVNSLSKRNNFKVDRSYFLWLSHMLGSLFNTQGEKRILLDYDRLLHNPESELTRVAQNFDLGIDQVELQNYSSSFLDQGLRHTRFDVKDMDLDVNCPQLVRDVYCQLLEVASDRASFDDRSVQDRMSQWAKEWQQGNALMRLTDAVCDDNDRATLRIIQNEQVLKHQESRIDYLQEALNERDTQIANSNKSSAASATTIAKLNKTVLGLNAQVVTLRQDVAERDGQIIGLHQAGMERDGHIAALHREVMARDALVADIISSTSWKMTRPCRSMGLRARQIYNAWRTSWLEKKKRAHLDSHQTEEGASAPGLTLAPGDVPVEPRPVSHPKQNVSDLVKTHAHACAALRVYRVPSASLGRVNIITDSINSGSLYGGVGTAIILASLLAEARNARLRIITRTEQGLASNLAHVLETYGIHLPHEVEFVFAPFWDNQYEIDIGGDECFITTSWWTTAATMKSISHNDIIYLLQEDERMFYPYGDERLRCSQVLQNKEIHFVLNTKLMYEHLVADGLENIAERGSWFEPAFPKDVFFPRRQDQGGKRIFMFYARPNNLRNLFYFGLELIDEAIKRGILDPVKWDIRMVGKDIPELIFADTCVPTRSENLQWAEYAELVGNVDLGLCLMYTPHPSYPPLDLAASGAVVVTNRFGRKRDLTNYSKNIVCGDLDLESMLVALAEGIRLAEDTEERRGNYNVSGLGSDWRAAFSGVVQQFSRTM